MPKAGNSAQKRAARAVQLTLQIPYTQALGIVVAKKTRDITWDQVVDLVIDEAANQKED